MLLVACLLTQLTFCVSALYMFGIRLSLFFAGFILFLFFFEALFDGSVIPSDRFVYKAADHDPDCGWTFVLSMGGKNN